MLAVIDFRKHVMPMNPYPPMRTMWHDAEFKVEDIVFWRPPAPPGITP
jgi:hypothetical protein